MNKRDVDVGNLSVFEMLNQINKDNPLISNRLQYWQGWRAYFSGVLHTSNPYSNRAENVHYNQWNMGWHDAAIKSTSP
jgi:hypothetical protein